MSSLPEPGDSCSVSKLDTEDEEAGYLCLIRSRKDPDEEDVMTDEADESEPVEDDTLERGPWGVYFVAEGEVLSRTALGIGGGID